MAKVDIMTRILSKDSEIKKHYSSALKANNYQEHLLVDSNGHNEERFIKWTGNEDEGNASNILLKQASSCLNRAAVLYFSSNNNPLGFLDKKDYLVPNRYSEGTRYYVYIKETQQGSVSYKPVCHLFRWNNLNQWKVIVPAEISGEEFLINATRLNANTKRDELPIYIPNEISDFRESTLCYLAWLVSNPQYFSRIDKLDLESVYVPYKGIYTPNISFASRIPAFSSVVLCKCRMSPYIDDFFWSRHAVVNSISDSYYSNSIKSPYIVFGGTIPVVEIFQKRFYKRALAKRPVDLFFSGLIFDVVGFDTSLRKLDFFTEEQWALASFGVQIETSFSDFPFFIPIPSFRRVSKSLEQGIKATNNLGQ